MLFCSYQYLLFFGGIFFAYWLLPWHRARVWLLLGASLYFYASWNKWLACLIAFSSTLDYAIGLTLERTKAPAGRRGLVALSVVANLGLLAYFKYANFFLQSVEASLHALGATASLPVLQVILPVGISFYTFEAINYTVDVYRGHVRAERSLPRFLLFITFFPHLVAGPIVRARDFLPQIGRPKRWNWGRVQLGAQCFLVGLFKKSVADRMALFVDPVYAHPGHYGTAAVALAVLAYALQIYCDFSGYSDMAVGSAHMLGYKLARNFHTPYLAVNVSDFWRRWHISLSSWLRDYVFIPLGGSRAGGPRAGWLVSRNLLITMTLGGLWHGPQWTFVAWGVLHGLLLVVHRGWRGFCAGRPRLAALCQSPPGTAARVALTFACVCVGWVFFRAGSFAVAGEVLSRLFVPHAGLPPPLHVRSLCWLFAAVFLGSVLSERRSWARAVRNLPGPVLGAGYASVLILSLVLAPDAGKAFIYFQF